MFSSLDRGRSALFVDGHHLYIASRALGFDVDYRQLLQTFRDTTNLTRAYYYATVLETEEYTPLKPLTDWLNYNGWCVFSKPAREYQDSTGRRRMKGSINVEMACDMLEASTWANGLQHAIIMSGESDLKRPVEIIQRRGVKVTIISAMRGTTNLVSDELRRQADEFIELSTISEGFTRTEKPK